MSDGEVLETVVGPVRLRRSNRRTLAISVNPDGSVGLTAPQRADVAAIQAKVAKRATWIRKQQRAFTAMNAKRMPRRYVSGATHRYLGRQYRLKVRKGADAGVKLSAGYFHVVTPDGSEAGVETLLAAWMRERANEQFSRRLAEWRSWCERHRIPAPRLILRSMPKRWGSTHKDGRIALNPELVHAPSACVDYVIAHEICHLKHTNHGPEFFRLLDVIFPSWRVVKHRLENAEM
jgi:predicted metal-dependent hydrolase